MENILNCIAELKGKKYVVLGVAFDWSNKKGLDVFENLSARLKSERYQVVLVGTNREIDNRLPANIISFHRTQNQMELAQLYTAADVFVMPTREENFPTVNLEALACGTPVVTFNTGGSSEMIDNKTGVIVPCGDIDCLEDAIRMVCENDVFREEDCRLKALNYSMEDRFQDYLNLYKAIALQKQEERR